MKKPIIILYALLVLIALSFKVNAQDENHQGKSYVKIRTMKIVNGDTIVTEKEYTGDGSMNLNLEDSLDGQGFSDFSFNRMPQGMDSSFMNKFGDMQNMFRGFEFNGNDFNFPEFHFDSDPNSMMRQYNFDGIDTLMPGINEHQEIDKNNTVRNFSGNDTLNKLDNPGFYHGNSGKMENDNSATTDKKIIEQNNIMQNTDNNASGDVDIFMNPAENFVNISFCLSPKNKTVISISSAEGKKMQGETIGKAKGRYTRQFDLNLFPKGTYNVFIKQGRKQVVKQFFIS